MHVAFSSNMVSGNRRIVFLALLFFAASDLSCVPAEKRAMLDLSTPAIATVRHRYGPVAGQRLDDWMRLIAELRARPVDEQVSRVNEFFNSHVRFVEDQDNWGVADRWSTPMETVLLAAGDCEDLAIVKYFTLVQLGLDEERLHLTYVKSVPLNQGHMVLLVALGPLSETLVMDNLYSALLPLSVRTDLVPIYGFNAQGVRLMERTGPGRMVGQVAHIVPWREVAQRIRFGQVQFSPVKISDPT